MVEKADKKDGREARSRRTRTAILETAYRLFDENGYASTTVTEIAQRAGVSERGVYVHFPSKEDLLFDHVHRFSELAWLTADQTDSADPRVRVECAMRALIDASCTEESLLRQAHTRAILGATGKLPRALASHLLTLATELIRRVVATTGRPPSAVAPMVGASIGAIEAAGLVAAAEHADRRQLHSSMTRALEAALAGFSPTPASSTRAGAPPETTAEGAG